jgi:hypothetical protein
MSADQARQFLRPHYGANGSPITVREEIDFRESFDQALEELQLLELAVECGYLPLDEVRPVAEAELAVLLASGGARTYVKFYDFVPVRFLAARLGQNLDLRAVTPPAINPTAAVRYATFLAIHSEFTASVPIEKFTMLIDDYRFAGVLNAQFFKDRLSGTPGLLTNSQEAVFSNLCMGLVSFVQTLGDLFLLLESPERPLFGCFYSYWLSHFFGVRRTEGGYESRGVSFEQVEPNPMLFPPLEPDALCSEQERLRHRIGVLKGAWDETRSFIESLE